jgi:hypothetical protein
MKTMSSPDKKLAQIYRGDVKGIQAVRHGKGTCEYLNGGGNLFMYTGNYEEGKKTGDGAFRINSFSEYTGEFLDGEISGKDILLL